MGLGSVAVRSLVLVPALLLPTLLPVLSASPGSNFPGCPAAGPLAAEGDGFLDRLCRNLATARAASERNAQPEASPLAKGVALVAVATAWQADALEVPRGRPSQRLHDSPSAAALALVEVAGVPPDPDLPRRLAGYDALPEPARSTLTRLLEAIFRLQDVKSTDYQVVLPERAALLQAAEAFRAGLEAVPTEARPPPVAVASALSLDLHATAGTYTDDYLFALDAGGDDTYHNNAGGNGFACAGCPGGVSSVRAAALLDLAGNDRYGTDRGRGQNGGAMGGVGILVDAGGDDLYASTLGGTNGGACRGVGLLLDAGGNDRYEGTWYYTNGGGETGAGLLVDVSGDDSYRASLGDASNGGASVDGVGFLLDGAGDDAYHGGAAAANGGVRFNGQGFLLDLSGNDHYEGTTEGVNGAGPVSREPGPFGFLYDAAGVDTYADQEEPNGSGTDRTVLPKGRGAQIDEPFL